tara:strand:+ start:4126 stop:4746 length:621 start_codon:yes stop_codon:yes gene_type:complete
MVRTHSTMLPIGTEMPPFDMDIVPGLVFSVGSSFEGLKKLNNDLLSNKPTLFMIICAHCPFVKHIETEITSLFKDYGESVQFIAVCSNSVITHPQDGPEHLAKQANSNGWQFPYLTDDDQTFAKSLKAACTPDFYLFSGLNDKANKLRYRGQLDESTPGNNIPITGNSLRTALDYLLAGTQLKEDQKPSLGCNIKWHPGKEPAWFG